jgi:hypothetical protein
MGSLPIDETLAVHNALRAAHGAPPLEWSDECYELAAAQAEAMAASGSIFHDNTEGPSGHHGQNVAMAMPEITPTMAIKMWYNEVNDPGYDYDSPGFGGGTGHFTQVVWAETTHVGLAVSADGQYVCANYLPGGNMMMDGYFEANVLPSETTDFDEIVGAGAPTTRGVKLPGAPAVPGLDKLFALFGCCKANAAEELEETFEDLIPDELDFEEADE